MNERKALLIRNRGEILEEILGGQKSCQCADSELSEKILTDYTLQIGLK